MNDLAPDDKPGDSDIQRELAALRRAAVHARELAECTGTPCWIMRDWRIVDVITGREAVLPATSAVRDPVYS
jgi:hypothetical protein